MRRTSSGFVVVKQGFFRNPKTSELCVAQAGFYPLDECVSTVPETGEKLLTLPDSAVVVLPKHKFKV